MVGSTVNNRFVTIKVVGVNTGKKISGGLSALNFMLEKNLSGVNYFAVDRQDISNLDACNATRKFRLLDAADEQKLSAELRGADLIIVVADEVWENVTAVSIATHCAKKVGVPVVIIAGGDFDYAEDEIIFDALVKLPSRNFAADTCKVVENFIEAVTLDGQPKLNVKDFSELVSDSAAIIGYGERDGKNSVVKAAKAAIEHAESSDENFKTATKILFNITAAKGNLSLEEAQKLSNLLKRHAPKAEVSFGFAIDDWLVDRVKFLLAAV